MRKTGKGWFKMAGISDVCFIFLFIVIGLFLFWKSRYGYVDMDEAFYLTIPYRLLQGDALFWDEWAPSQMSGFVTYPIIAAFVKITGGTNGVYLYIRYFYTVCKLCITLYMYHVLKKVNCWGALFSASLFLIFADYGMQVLSYNSLAIGGLVVCLLLLWDLQKKADMKCVLAGIALSVAVLATPSLAILYILYGITVFSYNQLRKKEMVKLAYISLTWRAYLFLSLGVSIMIISFGGFIFSRISLDQLVESIPNIMMDPEHEGKKIWKIIPGYLARIVMGNEHNWYTFIVYSLFAIVFLWVVITLKKGIDQRRTQFVIVILLTLLLLITYYLTNEYINHTIFVLNVPAVFFPLLSKDEKLLYVFRFLYLPGMIFTFLEYIVSNTGFSGISGASCVATMGSSLMLIMMLEEFSITQNITIKRMGLIVTNALIVMFSVILLYQRYSYIFWEGPVWEQTQLLTEGPQAGLLVSEDKERLYLAELEDMETILKETDGIYFLNLHDESLYLASDMRFSIYSAHPFGIHTNRDILFHYYEVHPDKVPDIAYLYSGQENIAKELCERLDMKRFEGGKEGIILVRK